MNCNKHKDKPKSFRALSEIYYSASGPWDYNYQKRVLVKSQIFHW